MQGRFCKPACGHGIRCIVDPNRLSAIGLLWMATVAGASAQTALSPPFIDDTASSLADSLSDDRKAVLEDLNRAGIRLKLQTIDDALGNPTGGRRQGLTNEPGNAYRLDVDLGKAAGLDGASFRASGYQVFGRGLSARNIDNINLVSSIEALRSAWLYELWVQQASADGRISLRLGQLGADTEFLVTEYGGWFVNSAFGWPSLPAVDLPAGGPAYPLATPGARLRVKPSDDVTLLAALFNGDPAGPGLGNPQRRDPSGTLFDIRSGILAIAEAQWAPVGAGGGDPPLTIKLGGWYHSKASPNQFYANDGLTVVAPQAEGSSIARENASLYGVVDALLVRGLDGHGGMAAFARISLAPETRSQVAAEYAGGLVYLDPFGRRGDRVGLGVTSVQVGQALPTDASRFTFRGYETVIEASYRIQVAPGVRVQPDAQYVINPGGGLIDPARPGRRIGSAAVFGLRTIVTF